jgi:TRAP-type C4-dicarboxylate transport system permease small subunit
MKLRAYTYIGITTFLLFLIVITSAMNFSFGWIFYTSIIGQIAIVFMVYKVLIDRYNTNKTFKDFYEDYPVREENYR